ncbi:MAG TPA: sigma-70 family RNA polymerase sigma factor [Candidatus Limnocylindrales bacterium]|nr:sigma-70 family RNA polymerase sigma factor [Candidatus Limnocylindrales bacterium]
MGAGAGTTDAELMARVVQRDEEALLSLYDRHGEAVFRVAHRLLGDRHLAEDVMQETFLTLWTRAELFDRRQGPVAVWLLTIARNRAVDRLRAAGRRPATVPLSAVFADGAQPDAERVLPRGGLVAAAPAPELPEAMLEAGWLRGVVREALAQVPDQERRALELAYFEELTQSEIALRLGWPLGTVKTRTRRALHRLRTALVPLLGPELGKAITPVAPEPADGEDAHGPAAERRSSTVTSLRAAAVERQGGSDGSR